MSLTSYDNTIDNKRDKVVTRMGEEQGIIYLVSLINEKKSITLYIFCIPTYRFLFTSRH